MKRLTLDQTWEQCLKMWRWIVRQPCPRDVDALKTQWLEKNGFNYVQAGCFFCEFTQKDEACSRCPGAKVDRDFRCWDEDYEWEEKPAAFLREITELNKIRLTKKKGKK